MSPTRNSDGFTLLEMLVALGLVALIAVFAVPQFRGPSRDKIFDVTVRDLVGALRTARLEAIRGNSERSFLIDLQNRSAYIEGSAKRSPIPVDMAFDITGSAADLSGSRARLRFFPDGSASGGRIHISAGARSAIITVDWLTGHVKSEAGS